MLNQLLAGLFRTMVMPSNPIHTREALTPGHLYRLMSGEFRAFRSRNCSCVMPMIFTCEPNLHHACNWGVRELASCCPTCQPLVDEIVARHAAVYDVNDPTYLPSHDEGEPGAGHLPLFS
ncbi:MAG TPA: hypothetical protein VM122_00580 [Usitatibacter sp.]|nr:hypothetical protein [Usitatibacter sp.]